MEPVIQEEFVELLMGKPLGDVQQAQSDRVV